MSVVIYGIRACDTMKKAFTWLQDHDIAYDFHDYKKSGAPQADLERWCTLAGWEKVLNRAGTTFRKLPDADKANLNQEKAIALMVAQPSMIKRPVLDFGDRIEVGFKAERYESLFSDV